MKRIAYADAVVGTDGEVAALVLDYAARLARLGRADTVRILALPEGGRLQEVSLLLGPSSQITVYEDDEPFEGDAAPAVAELRRRIASLELPIPASDGPGLADPDDDAALPTG
ncbi:hypothetical protein [Amnibacterium endophyticum]|uniref:Uncharacterized protein n=1 Tax=Amnibacterium endophyticum TaxID=2109337 RepID=A0ABW4LDR2_9MICO